MTRAPWSGAAAVVAGLLLLLPGAGAAQELADYDYENLSFRGLGLEAGYLFPNRVEATTSIGVRVDMGFLGPNLRLSPFVNLWRSTLEPSEVGELEDRLGSLVVLQDPEAEPDVDLGTIDWSSFAIGMDAQYVFPLGGRISPFAGAGVSAHFMNGEGEAIRATFIEDLLDRITAGINVHGGMEWEVAPSFLLTGQARFEMMDDLRYLELRVGGMARLGGEGS